MNTIYPSSYFAGEAIGSPQEKKDYILTTANNSRGWYEPVFGDETKYLPVSKPVTSLKLSTPVENSALTLNDNGTLKDSSALTVPPQKENILLEVVLVAGAVFVIYKLLT